MQVHTVSFDDFLCDKYSIVGIHSAIEEYRLAYLLNLYLGINLKRCDNDVDIFSTSNKAFFPLYEYTDSNSEESWFLVSNLCKMHVKTDNIGLFSENETRIYLIPEKKKVDFFLKLEGDVTQTNIDKINEVINLIPEVITSYIIDTNKLKSKEFLIF
ncbi:hypothetical protein BTO06_14955 [Tenacibaculum sp. SZ-18]|uniref:IPExxxVDY family protein n=1 Tax=Tenacibaculum sp. SZ-18 TaxID=754423 RepID=UPI000C2D2388|nr:IPExxxVDY family protein [Tenacibaculum sp. SZ-18]AUC16369.1 hypothetical protein BTO06_14955 [Tenacibaculum sp. SZ-18]